MSQLDRLCCQCVLLNACIYGTFAFEAFGALLIYKSASFQNTIKGVTSDF